MGIRVKQVPEFGLTLIIWSGTVTREEVIEHYSRLTAADAGRRIIYLDPTLDRSGLDVASFPELRRIITAKFKELYGDTPVRSAIVRGGASVSEPDIDFWFRYAGVEIDYSNTPAGFPSFEAACEWLGLPDAACRAVREAIET